MPATKILRPFAIGTHSAWTLGAGATKVAAVDPGDPVTHDGDTTYLRVLSPTNNRQSFKIDPTFTERMAFVHSLSVIGRVRDEGSTVVSNMVLTILDGAERLSTVFNTPGTSYADFSRTLVKPGAGGDWTEDDFRNASFEFGIFTPSQSGAIRCTSLWGVASYEPLSVLVPQERAVASGRVFRNGPMGAIFTVTCRLSALADLEIGNLALMSHDRLPMPGSILERLGEHQLVEAWRKGIIEIVGMNFRPDALEVDIDFVEFWRSMASYRSSDSLPNSFDEDLDGISEIDIGASYSFARSTYASIEGSNSANDALAAEGQFLYTVPLFREKMNHVGYIAEEANTNPVLNSAFKNSLTNWTQVANGGTIGTDTTRKLWRNQAISDRAAFTNGTGASDVTHIKQTVAVLTADLYRRLSIYYTTAAGMGDDPAQVAIQRSSDNFWWNDSTEDFQSGMVWNTAASVPVGELWTRYKTKPIPTANENFIIQFGSKNGNNKHYWGQVDLTKERFLCTAIPTDAAAVTTVRDERKRTLDATSPVRQIVAAGGNSGHLEFVAVNKAADLDESDRLCLLYWQYGAFSGSWDADAILYEKTAGGVARFAFYRWIDGAVDAIAHHAIDVIENFNYRVSFRWVNTGGEFGIPARTMEIWVNDGGLWFEGTSAVASAIHSTSESHTELWTGSCPSGVTGVRNAHNYVRDIRFFGQPLPKEQIQR